MAGKHTNDWYKKDYKYRENVNYIDKKYDNGPSNYGSTNNGLSQSIQQLVGDERLVTAIQTLVERHTTEALKNLQGKLNTDSRHHDSVDQRGGRHSASGSRNYDNPNYPSDNRYSEADRRRSDLQTGSDLIEYFDPDNANLNVEDWLDKIDHVGTAHNWSEYERCYYMQNRLTGAAKTWYNRLRSTDLLWHEWKNALVTTFSVHHDYASLVTEMLARKKLPGESVAQYFSDKVKLCERCEFTNDKAVSFVIHGLPKEFQAEARAFRCWTPNELYDEFLSKLDRSTGGRSQENIETRSKELPNDNYYSSHTSHATSHAHTKRHHDDNWNRQLSSDEKRKSKSHKPSLTQSVDKARCYNCRKTSGHLAKDCPHAKVVRCRDCGSKTHKSGECKFKLSRSMK